MPADQALNLLLEGNQRFVQGKSQHPNQSPARRTEIAKEQHPFAAILACFDSRVDPSIVFDCGLGDIFVVRVAGNVADQVVIDSLNYSVKNFGVRLIMVLGHTRCAAVTAAVEAYTGLPEVGALLRELEPAVRATREMPGDPVANAINTNVQLTMSKLTESPELRAMVASRELTIAGGIYDLETGQIEMLKAQD